MDGSVAVIDSEQAAYFRRREHSQRVLADKAHDPHIAGIHLQMAAEYATRLAAVDGRSQTGSA